MKIAILGTGSFGTSLAIHLASKADKIQMWGNNIKTTREINTHRTNSKYLKNSITIPDNVSAHNNIEEVLLNSKYIILAVPSHAIKSISRQIREHITDNQIIINLAKGLEENTLERLSSTIEVEANSQNIVVLSGPSHAEEIVRNIPTTIVASSKNMKLATKVQSELSTNTMRIYTNSDIIGVELGGAAKNIIALAAGILDGLGYGDNAKAALMVRGMKEIIAIGTLLGGKEKTFSGLSGMGDLIVTCTSKHSRNKQAGILFANGNSLDSVTNQIGMVVEGIKSCQCFHKLAIERNIELPITNSLYNILFEKSNPQKEIHTLLTREKKDEF